MCACLGLQSFLFGIRDVEEEEGPALFGKTMKENREIAEREENASFCDREVEDLIRDRRTGGKDLYNRLL